MGKQFPDKPAFPCAICFSSSSHVIAAEKASGHPGAFLLNALQFRSTFY